MVFSYALVLMLLTKFIPKRIQFQPHFDAEFAPKYTANLSQIAPLQKKMVPIRCHKGASIKMHKYLDGLKKIILDFKTFLELKLYNSVKGHFKILEALSEKFEIACYDKTGRTSYISYIRVLQNSTFL